jgi:hypothetical protein
MRHHMHEPLLHLTECSMPPADILLAFGSTGPFSSFGSPLTLKTSLCNFLHLLLTMLTFPSCMYLVVVVYIPIRVSLVSHALYPPRCCMLRYYVFMLAFHSILKQLVITLYPLMTLRSKQTSHLTFMFYKCLQIHVLYILFTPHIQFITLPPTLLCLANLPCRHIDH